MTYFCILFTDAILQHSPNKSIHIAFSVSFTFPIQTDKMSFIQSWDNALSTLGTCVTNASYNPDSQFSNSEMMNGINLYCASGSRKSLGIFSHTYSFCLLNPLLINSKHRLTSGKLSAVDHSSISASVSFPRTNSLLEDESSSSNSNMSIIILFNKQFYPL